MSTTMLSSSSCSRRKVASTRNVAPCSRCAGPKTSPRKLWAIMMWSRTVILNTVEPSRAELCRSVVNTVAEHGSFTAGDTVHHLGQLVERTLSGDQCVEGGIGQQTQGDRHPVGVAAARAAVGRHRADLAAADDQPA